MISTADVRRLSSGRWLVAILATMSADGGSRFGVLARKLGASRSVLTAHLAIIEGFGWMVRAPGHGHPLRPEYLLTPEGRTVGAWCERVVAQRRRFAIDQTGVGRWSLPLMIDLVGERKRFTAIQQSLVPVTARALSLSLKQLQHIELIDRGAHHYGLTDRGRRFTRPLLLA